MDFTHQKHNRYSVLTIDETNIDNIKASELKSEIILLNAEGIKNIILDMEKVKYIDSSGLGAILIGDRECKKAKGTFVVTNPSKQVFQLIKISQLHNILNIIPTLKESIDFVLLEELERDLRAENVGHSE